MLLWKIICVKTLNNRPNGANAVNVVTQLLGSLHCNVSGLFFQNKRLLDIILPSLVSYSVIALSFFGKNFPKRQNWYRSLFRLELALIQR